MTAFRLDDLRQYSDLLRCAAANPLPCASSNRATAECLQAYFRSLSTRSRYNRFFGAMSELPQTALDQFIHVGEDDRFSRDRDR